VPATDETVEGRAYLYVCSTPATTGVRVRAAKPTCPVVWHRFAVLELPRFDVLSNVDHRVLRGLLAEYGTPSWKASYEDDWRRYTATWTAVYEALHAAAAGGSPAELATKAPTWLDALVRERISHVGRVRQYVDVFSGVRLLERLGLVTLEPDEAYVLALVGGFGDRNGHPSRAEQLRADPELLSRLWRVFEVEGGGEISLTNVDKFSSISWQTTFVELVADGTLDRSRVLLSCLDALQRDFSAYRAAWFSALYAALEPTLAESSGHQTRYRALLRSSVTATVSMAARRLRALSTAAMLDDGELAELRPGVHARTKSAALDMLHIVDDIRGRRPDLHSVLADVTGSALEHPNADVQRAAVRLLTKLGARALAEQAAADLAPSVQRDLGHQRPEPTSQSVATAAFVPTSVAPVAKGDVLARTAGLLEDSSDPLEVELVLASLAGIRDPSVLRPLAKRAAALIDRGQREGVGAEWLGGHIARLILLADGQRPAPQPVRSARMRFLVSRLDLVGQILAGALAPRVLLATPTSSVGWLDPDELLRRLAVSHAEPQTEDMVAALLRLAPEGRSEAHTRVRRDDHLGAVIRHALGAPPPERALRISHGRRGLVTQSLWVAASRARAPHGVDSALMAEGLVLAGQGRPVHAEMAATSEPFVWNDRRGSHRALRWTFSLHVADSAREEHPLQPTVAVSSAHAPWTFYYEDLEDWAGWLMLTYPHDAEAALTELFWPVVREAQGDGVEHDSERVLSAIAAHPGRVGTLGALTLAAGLAADRAENRVLAVDAILIHVAAGRLSADVLAQAMASLAGFCQAGRWAASLSQLAEASGDSFVNTVLTLLLPRLALELRGVHALLELLLEDTLRRGSRPDGALRSWLEGFSGGSRAARAARQLCAL